MESTKNQIDQLIEDLNVKIQNCILDLKNFFKNIKEAEKQLEQLK